MAPASRVDIEIALQQVQERITAIQFKHTVPRTDLENERYRLEHEIVRRENDLSIPLDLFHLRKKADDLKKCASVSKDDRERALEAAHSLENELSEQLSRRRGIPELRTKLEQVCAAQAQLEAAYRQETEPLYQEWQSLSVQLQALKNRTRKDVQQEKARLYDRRTRKDKARIHDERTRKDSKLLKKGLAVGSACPYCGISLNGSDVVVDHIYPVSLGGLAIEQNMVHSCFTCNSMKTDYTLQEFMQRYGLDREVIEGRLRELGKRF